MYWLVWMLVGQGVFQQKFSNQNKIEKWNLNTWKNPHSSHANLSTAASCCEVWESRSLPRSTTGMLSPWWETISSGRSGLMYRWMASGVSSAAFSASAWTFFTGMVLPWDHFPSELCLFSIWSDHFVQQLCGQRTALISCWGQFIGLCSPWMHHSGSDDYFIWE